MSAIITWLVNIAKAIGHWFADLFHEAIHFTTTIWGLLVLLAGLVWTAMSDTVGAVQQILSLVGGMNFSTPSLTHGGASSVGFLCAVCNTFVPLDELFAYSASYLVLVGGFGLYRLVKSWIPTLSGS